MNILTYRRVDWLAQFTERIIGDLYWRLQRCVDCRVNPGDIHEYYMVHDDVWAASGLGEDDGMLCIGCLEERLGFTLTPDDFPDVPLNQPPIPQSDRLQARLMVR